MKRRFFAFLIAVLIAVGGAVTTHAVASAADITGEPTVSESATNKLNVVARAVSADPTNDHTHVITPGDSTQTHEPEPPASSTPEPSPSSAPTTSSAPEPTATPSQAPGPTSEPTPEPFFPVDDICEVHIFYEMGRAELAAIPESTQASGARMARAETECTTDMYGRELTSAFFFYRGTLNEEDQIMYDAIYEGAMSGELEVPFRHPGSPDKPDQDRIMNIVRSVRYDHPELFWLEESYSYGYGKRTDSNGTKYLQMKIVFNPCQELYDDLDGARSDFEASANKIITFAEENGSNDAEKAKIVHDTIIDLTDYVTDSPYNQNAYSTFVNHETVCAGYAKAFQYCLHKLGIPCSYLVGDARSGDEIGLHAWSIAQLDGDLYVVDSTWDDTGNENYTYFNLTDDEIGEDHFRTEPSLQIPLAYGTKYSTDDYFKDAQWSDTSGVASADDTLPMEPKTSPHAIEPDAGADGEVWSELEEATQGQIVALRAKPDSGRSLWEWSVEYGDTEIPLDVTSADGATFTMPDENVKIKAIFGSADGKEVPYKIASPSLLGGSVGSPEDSALPGTEVELTPVAEKGYHLKSVAVTSGTTTTELDVQGDHASFTMPSANVTVTAAFEDEENRASSYTVSLPAAAARGGITAEPAVAHVGEQVTLSAAPQEGYQLASWGLKYGSGSTDLKVNENNTLTFTMPARNVHIDAILSLEPAELPEGIELDADSALGFYSALDGSYVLQGQAAAPGSATTVADLKNALHLPDGMQVQVTGANGESVADDAAIGTGHTVQITEGSTPIVNATVIIKGDVVGSGTMTVSQLTSLASHFKHSGTLEGPYYEAGDLCGDGTIGLSDLVGAARALRNVTVTG